MNAAEARAILESYRAKGIGGRVGFGRSPAVLVVDFIVGFTDPASPLSGPFESELGATLKVLDVARDRGVPILFSTVSYENGLKDAGLFPKKVPALEILKAGTRWVEVDPRLCRRPNELLLVKKFASCFFGTSLSSHLKSLGVDTLIVTGCTTSGCVRATAVDALQHGFRCIVPLQCVGDRATEAHVANLLDIDAKYGDVVSDGEVLNYLKSGHYAESEGTVSWRIS